MVSSQENYISHVKKRCRKKLDKCHQNFRKDDVNFYAKNLRTAIRQFTSV